MKKHKINIFGIYSVIFIVVFCTMVSAVSLPTVGGDSDSWGTILNDYLTNLAGANATELNQTMVNGSNIYASSINTTHLVDGTITETDISNTTNLTLGQKITFTLGEVIDNIVDGWITITGNLNVTKDLNVVGNATILGDLNVTKDLNIVGNATILGNLNVTGISYLGDITINADNITTNNILPKDNGDVNIGGNLTLGEKITFTLGEVIDNIVDGWITITGGLNVTGNIATEGNITADYFIGDGSKLTNVSRTDLYWNITGSNYLYNNSGILDINETILNATIDNRDSTGSTANYSILLYTENITNMPDNLANFTNTPGYITTDTNVTTTCSGNDEVLTSNNTCVSLNSTISALDTDTDTNTDTNASTECSTGEHLDGDGNCINTNSTIESMINANTSSMCTAENGYCNQSTTVEADSINGTELADTITLDADMNILDYDFAVNNSNLYVDVSTDRVGIGTTTPNSALEVNGHIRSSNINASDDYVIIGEDAGDSNSGTKITAIGFNAAKSNSANNIVAIGYQAGNIGSGRDDVMIGYESGESNSGDFLTAVGYKAGRQNTQAYSTFIGYNSGSSNAGYGNTAVGAEAGYISTGHYSTGIGYQTLYNNTADNVVAIGYRAGKNNTVPDQFIVRHGRLNSLPLIQGNFSSGYVGIGTTLPSHKLNVIGDANITGNVTADYFIGNGSQLKGILTSWINNIITLDWLNITGNKPTNATLLSIGTLYNATVENMINANTSSMCTAENGFCNQSTAISADSINGTQLADTINLDANMNIVDGNFSINNSNLFVDVSNEKIGIGTTTPSEKLTVAGNINVTSNNVTSVECIVFASGGKICDSP